MVEDPLNYHWSSYRCNAMGQESELLTPHGEYLGLAKTQSERLQIYRDFFKNHIPNNLLTEIRKATNTNMAFGSEKFKGQIEVVFNRRVRPNKPGRKKSK